MAVREHDKCLGFVRLVHRLRTLGLALAALPVASVLWQQRAPGWLWALLALNGYAWPHLAWLISTRSRQPNRTEQRNLLLDAASAGAWVALMRFNLLPSALLLSMLAMDRVGAGGWRLFGLSLLLEAVACVAVGGLLGFPVQWHSDTLNVFACLPMLMLYPVWVSTVNHALSQRVREQNRLLDRLNRTDSLTGLPNRTHWLEAAALELRRYQRNQRPAALILLDVDNFKQVNDSRGHAAGDAVLCELARLLEDNLREVDTPGRLGGDEFGVVLPETGLAQALAVAERIRCRAGRPADDPGGAQAWTLSLGVAGLDAGTADLGAWMHQADEALYRAKLQGRNRVGLPRRPHAAGGG
ncbi:diguanylate cyclase [Fulvimonas soli]|jgi:diguanylate cyclase|uniref:diguanylate cyclase n=1 Tax=Fulvimonas soli TaxID=155197 RepID=A0A316IDZ8_9GAMM|nr:diguanylate cyclase [Fulvimonas soli]PWK88533.1 diguanylate cyclase [Fulvimonas soli]TNY27463.1 hypothetical protein BV497_03490 [Fulvimonas soli]